MTKILLLQFTNANMSTLGKMLAMINDWI